MQRQFRRNIIFPLYRILCQLISTITTQVMQTYGDWQLQLQSSRLLSVVMLETFFLMWQLLSHRVTPPPRILVVGLCILLLRQFIPNMFRILSIILILVISQSTKTTHRLPLIRTKVVHRIDLSPLVNLRNYWYIDAKIIFLNGPVKLAWKVWSV